MQVQHHHNAKVGVFFIEEGEKRIAFLTYKYEVQEKLIIEHTEVLEKYEGNGLGKQLVQTVVEFARETNRKILPLCTFAKDIFDETPEFKDVKVELNKSKG